jgi:phage-related protein
VRVAEMSIPYLIDRVTKCTEFGISEQGGKGGKKPEEILKEIDRRFGGGAEKLGKTARGKFSTATGTLEASLANFGTAFLPAMSKTFDSITGMLDKSSPSLMAFSERLSKIDLGGLFSSFDFSTVTDALKPVTDLLDKMFTGIETKSPVTMGVMQVLGTIFNVVFSGIGAVIKAIAPTVESIFKFIGKYSVQISAIIQDLGSVWNAIWSTMGVLLNTAWAIIKPLLNSLVGFLSTVGKWIKDIGKWWIDMCDKIKNSPITAKINQVWEGVTKDHTKDKTKKGQKKAFGTHRVVGNDVPYRLHDGEKILTRQEADNYDKGNSDQGVVINVHGMTIREEADIKRVAKEFVRELKSQQISFGGAY